MVRFCTPDGKLGAGLSGMISRAEAKLLPTKAPHGDRFCASFQAKVLQVFLACGSLLEKGCTCTQGMRVRHFSDLHCRTVSAPISASFDWSSTGVCLSEASTSSSIQKLAGAGFLISHGCGSRCQTACWSPLQIRFAALEDHDPVSNSSSG